MVVTAGIVAPPTEEPILAGIMEDVQNVQIIPIAKMGTSDQPQDLPIVKKIPQSKNKKLSQKKNQQTHQLRNKKNRN